MYDSITSVVSDILTKKREILRENITVYFKLFILKKG